MSSSEPVALSPTIQGLLEQICDRRGLSCMRMPSGAVHDAQVMATVGGDRYDFHPEPWRAQSLSGGILCAGAS